MRIVFILHHINKWVSLFHFDSNWWTRLAV